MKINFNQALKTLDGKDLKMQAMDENNKPIEAVVDLKTICVQALVASTDNDQALAPTKKIEYYELAKTINKGGEVDVEVKELGILKDLIQNNPRMNIIVVGQSFAMLEGK